MPESLLILFSLGIFGLIFGSFANALVWRLKTEQTLMGRSMCPACRAQINWYDNIPVLSFLWLRGRCRDCRKPIAWQYPLVELAMAAGFIGIGWALTGMALSGVDFLVTLLFWCVLWFLLLVVAVFDWLYFEIPMVMIWIGLAVAIGFDAWQDWQLGGWNPWFSHLVWGVIAGGGAFGIFTLLSRGTKERWMGWGDAWLVLLLGLVLGWPGILWAITLGSGIGSVLGLILLALHRGSLKTRVPFAPLLILGLWLTVGVQWFGFGEGLFW